jgi:AP-3 complex subunit beta
MRQRTFSLARFDADWDVRDRARFLQGLIRGSLGSEETPTVDTEENVSGGVVLRPEQAFMILGTDPPSKARSERTGKII